MAVLSKDAKFIFLRIRQTARQDQLVPSLSWLFLSAHGPAARRLPALLCNNYRSRSFRYFYRFRRPVEVARRLRAYRDVIAAVMQEDQLFAGTILDNITFNSEATNADRAEICSVTAGIHDEIAAMPMAYQTFLGDMSCLNWPDTPMKLAECMA
jgi:hypothetical protein